MSFGISLLGPTSPRVQSPRLEDYDSSSSTDSVNRRTHSRSRAFVTSNTATASSGSPRPDFLFPPTLQSGRSSVSSTATTTPIPSRSASPLPQYFFSSLPQSSCTSDTDSEPSSPLLRARRPHSRFDDSRWWWNLGGVTRRRRRRAGKIVRMLRKWTRRIIRHPLFPRQPITILLTLLLLSVLAISITLLLIYILNPDKEPLPWRAYCSVPSSSPNTPDYLLSSGSGTTPYPVPSTSESTIPPFPPQDLDELPPAGVFIGVFSMDSSAERRMLARTMWASHPRSREGAGAGDGGVGTSRSIVRFILGQPRKNWERRIRLEMETYNDIVILPISENMNSGKTHTFFSWASINAWVPPVYENASKAPQFSYSNYTASPPRLAPHDPVQAWQDQMFGKRKAWVRPDYVVKADDDSFILLAELEARLRVELHTKSQRATNATYISHPRDEMGREGDPWLNFVARPVFSHPSSSIDPLIYWGYLVKNRFMAGELYALSWSLVDWVAKDPAVKYLTKGAEDKQTAKWMRLHPRASEIRWKSERCWIYDHPRSGTVYAHGFLFPSEVTRVKRKIISYLDKNPQDVLGNSPSGASIPTPASWAHSSVSTFGIRYVPPIPDLTVPQSVEALVEGGDMSMLREGSPMTPEYAMIHREGRKKRYEGKRVGGTVVVHFIKKNMWFLETALALLEGDEFSEAEKFQRHELERAAEPDVPVPVPPETVKRAILKHRRR